MPSNTDALVLNLPIIVLPTGGYLSTPPLDLHATDFTIATKVNLNSTANRNIILGNWSNNQNAWQLLFAINGGGAPAITLRKDLPTNGSQPNQDLLGLVGTLKVTAGQFNHVAVTFSWGKNYMTPTATLYVNGKVAGTVSPTISPDEPGVQNPYTLKRSSNAYLIGRKEDSNGASDGVFAGQFSDFRIYTAALTDAEIGTLL
ncbi:LamG domain-containing protein [Aerosakkonemataceae cyanobacterium BLCC-F154]|uniref:LamG domain-containing protein n=1 Tax=Floridaenema fluviatile BLCC-F154 TaxID=3153640 RepID=A0ABV4YIZ7_9CYAN